MATSENGKAQPNDNKPVIAVDCALGTSHLPKLQRVAKQIEFWV